jgi:beta-glucosidase
LYPFGFGLSYTTFEYSNLRTSADSMNAAGEIAVSVDVKNTGTRAGDEVVQMYVKHLDPGSAVERPSKELRGFQRIALQPNETRTVQMPLKGTESDILGRGHAHLRRGDPAPSASWWARRPLTCVWKRQLR